jgi:hypothetical protein
MVRPTTGDGAAAIWYSLNTHKRAFDAGEASGTCSEPATAEPEERTETR